MLCWCYVDGRGGVGHVNVMFMLRWSYVDGKGGVGWGMLTSCSCYVDATWCYVDGRGGVGPRGGVDNRVLLWSAYADVHLTEFRWPVIPLNIGTYWQCTISIKKKVCTLSWQSWTKLGNCLCQACSPPARFGMKPRGNFETEHVAAGWWSWSNNEQKRADYQHEPFHAKIKIHCTYQ